MKKIYTTILLLLGFLVSFGQAQPPIQSLGHANNIVVTNGYQRVVKGGVLTSWADTTAANADTYLKNIAGIQIRSADTIWQRSNDLTHWFRTGAGSIIADSSNSVILYGDGSSGSPLTAEVILSDQQGNAVQSTADGLYVKNFIQDGITEPGVITWIQNYDYDVSPATGVVGGVEYTTDWTQITLATADPTNDRIDLVVFNAGVGSSTGTITVIEGTPAADPQQPTVADPSTQLGMAFILVTANTTAPPSPPTQDWIYINNAEWTTASSNATIDPASTASPYSVPLDVRGVAAGNGHNIRFTAVSPPTISNFNVLTLKIRSASIWAIDSRISLRWYSGATPIGSAVSIANGAYGFTSAQLSSYQIVSIPLPDFGSLSSVTALLMTVTTTGGRTISFYIDDIQLQAGTIPVTGNFWAQGGNAWGTTGIFGTNDAYDVAFKSNNAERMRMLSNGNVLIGTTTDNSHMLRVNGKAWVDNTLTVADAPISAAGGIAVGIAVNKSLSGILGLDIENRNTSTGIAGITFGGLGSLLYTRSSNLMTLTGGTGGLRLQGGFSGITSIYSPGLALTLADFDGSNRISKFYGRLEGSKGADIASANSVTLGNNGNTFTITGTTQLNAIFPDNWQAGSVVHLLFSDVVLVKHNTAGDPGFARIFLAGSTDLTTDANTVLSLVYNGTQWEEMSRKLSGGAAITGVTADNGLNANTSTNVRLGGDLLGKTTITTGVYNLRIEGPTAIADSATVVIKNTNSPGTGRGLWVHSASSMGAYFEGFSGVQAVASDGQAVTASATGTGIAISATAITTRVADFTMNPSSTNDIANIVTLARTTSGTAANGIGGSLNFVLEASSSQDTSTRLISRWTDATLATRTSEFSITGVNNAGDNTTLFTLNGNGSIKFNDYGTGANTGTATYALATDADGDIIEIAVGGGTYTASNGLTMTANNTKLGGVLIEETTVGNIGDNFGITFNRAGTGAAATIAAVSTSGVGVNATSTSGNALISTSTSGLAAVFTINPSSTNTLDETIRVARTSSGTPANGLGGSINFTNEVSDNSQQLSARIGSTFTDVTLGTRTGDLQFWTTNSATSAIKATLAGSGALRLHNYGVNAFAGVAAYVLAVDASGNVVEVAAAGAGMSNPLTTNGDLIYGVGSTPTRLPIGTAGQVLTVNGGGTAPEWTTVVGTGSVTSVAQSFTGGLISVSGSPITTSGTLALTVAGTSGGGVYFSSASTWASTGALAANAIMIGGGAGAAYSTTTTGTGVLTALGVNVGSAGAFVVFDGALGTPSSGVATNLTGTATALNIGGNAATATILQTARTINGTSFDGSTNITVTAAAGTLTGTTLNSTVVTSSLTAVGTIATGVWQGTAVGDTYISSAATWNAKQTGDATLTALAGLTITNGSIIYGTGADAFSVLAAGSNGQVLTLAGGVPTWAAAGSGTVTSVAMSVPTFLSVSGSPITGAGTFAVSLSGTALPTANGGTGLTSAGTANQMLGMNSGASALEYKTITASNGASVTHSAGGIAISTVFNPTVQTLTDGATITWNVTNGGNAVVTLAGTGRTLSITNPVAGYTYTVRIIQGSGGSKTITTWPTNTKWPNGTAITLSTTAGDYDVVVLYYDGTQFLATYQNDFS